MTNKKTIISNTAIQLLGRLISSTLTFFSTYLIISLAGISLYGDLAKVTAMLAIAYTSLDFGINAHVVRGFAKDSKAARKTRYSNLLLLRTLLSVLVIIITSAAIYLLPGSLERGFTPDVKTAYFLGSLTIIFHSIHLTANSLFQHQLNYKKSVLASSTGAIVMFISSYLYLQGSVSLQELVFAIVLGYATNAVISLAFTKNYITLKTKLSSALRILKRSAPLGVLLLLSIVANKTDTIILGVFRSSDEVGQYSFAYKIFDFALVLPIFTMNSVYPTLLKKDLKAEDKKRLTSTTIKALTIISVLGAAAISLLSPLILLVRPELDLTPDILRVLAVSLPLFYATAPLMWLAISARLEKLIIPTYILAALVNIVGNTLLIPHYGVFAASSLTFVTESVILIGLYYANKRKNLI